MKAAVYSFSARGAELSKHIARNLQALGYEVCNRTLQKYAAEAGLEPMLPDHKAVCGEDFATCEALVFVGAAGIAVRTIAPFVKSKVSDPAVLAIDEGGNYVIPLLSGHIGGANELARALGVVLGAEACVTTATDVNGLFAVDEWAARNGLVLSSLKAAKEFAAALVDGQRVGLFLDTGIEAVGELPKQVEINGSLPVGMAITTAANLHPFRKSTVRLIPRIVHLGIGCRRNTPLENIEALVWPELEKLGVDKRSVAGIASIDVKADEEGLLAFAEKYKLPANFYSAVELNETEGEFTPSALVQAKVGVDNVCERSAFLDSIGGKLILRKTSLNGVTLAVAVKNYEVDFRRTGLKKDTEE